MRKIQNLSPRTQAPELIPCTDSTHTQIWKVRLVVQYFIQVINRGKQGKEKEIDLFGYLTDITAFESEKPTLYSIDEIAEATSDFDETRIIGQGGYGSVYLGVIGEKVLVGPSNIVYFIKILEWSQLSIIDVKQEVAIKKMRSNKSKEFRAELTVLCKIHHINVVRIIYIT